MKRCNPKLSYQNKAFLKVVIAIASTENDEAKPTENFQEVLKDNVAYKCKDQDFDLYTAHDMLCSYADELKAGGNSDDRCLYAIRIVGELSVKKARQGDAVCEARTKKRDECTKMLERVRDLHSAKCDEIDALSKQLAQQQPDSVHDFFVRRGLGWEEIMQLDALVKKLESGDYEEPEASQQL